MTFSLFLTGHLFPPAWSSYVVWEENGVVPTLVLEIVSQTYGGEYDTKMDIFARLGVLYYVIYNPSFWQRDRHQPWEVYRLVNGSYQLQVREPFWMPEIGLGIGRFMTQMGGLQREIVSWYDERNSRYQTAVELLERYRQRFGDLP
jgi:Uma2 family endonuclease